MKPLIFLILLSLVIGILPLPAHAQSSFALQNPLGTVDSLIDLIQKIIRGMIQLAIPLAAALVVWAGILYMSAGVSAEKAQKATKTLTYVVVGFGVLLISTGAVSIVQDLLGITPAPTPTGTPFSNVRDVVNFLSKVSGLLFVFAILAGVAMIILSGISYIFARGETEKANRAAKMIMYSAIGVAVASLAWAIVNIVANFLTGSSVFATLMIPEAYAQITSIPRPTIAPTGGPETVSALFTILKDVIGWLFVVGIVGGVGALIVAGILFITAAGSSERAAKATRMVIYTLVGVAVIALAWALVNVVGNFFLGERLIP